MADVRIEHLPGPGATISLPLPEAASLSVEDCLPIRQPPSYRGQRHKPGYVWFSKSTDHLRVESRLERHHVIFMDQDPAVRALAAQPFRIRFGRKTRPRSHVPDFFAELRTGTMRVVDAKTTRAATDPRNQLVFRLTELVCAELGWEFSVVSEPDPLWFQNVDFLSAFRRPTPFVDTLADLIIGAADAGGDIASVTDRVADATDTHPVHVRPVVYHLAWRQLIPIDLSIPISNRTKVGVSGGWSFAGGV